MKKYLMILSAAVLAFAFTACDKNKPSKKDVTFEITVSEIESSSALVKVVPSDTNAVYYWGVMPQASYTYANDAEAFADCLAGLKENAEYWEMMYQYFYGVTVDLSWTDFLTQGASEEGIDELDAETAYYVIAFAVDTTNEALLGKIYKVEFTTTQVKQINLTFTTQETDTALWIYPSIKDAYYVAMLASQDSLTAWGYNSPQEFFEDEYDYFVEEGAKEYFFSYDYGYGGYYGDIYVPYSIFDAGEKAYLMLRGYEGSTFNSELTVIEINTPAAASASEAPAIKKHNIMLKKYKKATQIKPVERNKMAQLKK